MLPSVCTRWHDAFKQTGSLWSHIDIFAEDWVDVNCPPAAALMRLQNAKNAPLHVHFGPKDDIKGSEIYLPQVPAIILLNSAKISSVEFSRFDVGNMITLMTTLLEISPITRLDLGGTTYLDSGATLGRQWPIHSFHGLVELQMSRMADQDCPSLSQLATMLANSPALQILRLRMMFVHPNADHNLQLVDLPHLRCLDFSGSVGPSHSIQALSIIGATSSSIYLVVPASKNDPNSSIAAAFLSRTRVASLYIWVADYYDTHLPAYLADARYLRMLILIIDNHDISNYLDKLIVSTEHGISPLLTTLETLYLIGGDIDENDLKRLRDLSSISSLNQLVFAKCSFLQKGNWVEVSSIEQYRELEAPEVKTILQQIPVVMFKEYDTEDDSWDLFLQHETLVLNK